MGFVPSYLRNEPGEPGYCDCCGEFCTPEWEDFGIGSYEYWGARGTHVDWQLVSPCCGADVHPELIETEFHKSQQAEEDFDAQE